MYKLFKTIFILLIICIPLGLYVLHIGIQGVYDQKTFPQQLRLIENKTYPERMNIKPYLDHYQHPFHIHNFTFKTDVTKLGEATESNNKEGSYDFTLQQGSNISIIYNERHDGLFSHGVDLTLYSEMKKNNSNYLKLIKILSALQITDTPTSFAKKIYNKEKPELDILKPVNNFLYSLVKGSLVNVTFSGNHTKVIDSRIFEDKKYIGYIELRVEGESESIAVAANFYTDTKVYSLYVVTADINILTKKIMMEIYETVNADLV